MASSSHPGALFEDPRRVELINEIAKAFNTLAFEGSDDTIESLRDCYGCLWLADLERLDGLVSQYLPHNPRGLLGLLRFTEVEGNIIDRWTQRDKRPASRAPSAPATPVKTEVPNTVLSSTPVIAGPSADEGSPSTPRTLKVVTLPSSPEGSGKGRKRKGEPLSQPWGKPPRREPAKRDCRLRDQTCILTKCRKDICQACHLYPYWMSDPNTKGVKQFFNALRDFWSAEKVEAWHNAIYGHVLGTERAANLILLSPNAHELHTRGYFALEPVEEDPEGKWITVKIWWLKQHTGVDFNIVPQLPPNQHPGEYEVGLHNIRDDKPLLSGDPITLETPDPINYPLPDFRILELQWILNRVLALRGGAEPKDLEEYESDEDSADELEYFARPVLQSPELPGPSSPPSSLTNIANDEPKANPVVATTDRLEQGLIEE
ncbi:hypothetical protein ALT_7396 [Aspergillus lentulus]|uniref:HNH nuclease domain-containing protein n=1 Tax=Aspergillus lentulus TaxID=293939 RepID=A0AAN4PP64_ASPLE|nr:hypothetical protein ALT_7396 [Aspergillus lentulus]